MRRVIPAVTTLHAEPTMIDRAFTSVGKDYPILFFVERQCAANAAIGADTIDGIEFITIYNRQCNFLIDKCPGRTSARTFTAGDTGTLAHRVVEIEGNLGTGAFAGAADHIVRLDIIAGTDATITEDTGRMVNGDDWRGEIKTF